jgi:homoserine O-acetyltransferase/O-succinyltransferase
MPERQRPWEQEGSAGVVATTTFALPDPLPLVNGRQLEGVEVAYETYGTLSPAGDNAILVCHALSGDAHVAGWRPGQVDANGAPLPDAKPGWWDIMIGPGKTIDTDKYFVVCSNVLGGCMGTTGPGSLDPATGKPYGLTFPIVTIEDMVELQARLLDHLGVGKLLSVVGGSMGGMQALAWPQRYPERVLSVVADATTPRLGAQAIAFNEVGRRAILEDPNFNRGDYYDAPAQPDSGLAIARMVGHITYLSDASMRQKFGRRLRERNGYAYDFVSEFEIESYLAYQGRRFVERFDANTYLYMTKAMDYFDLRGEAASLPDALRDIHARFLVLSFTSDWLFPTHNARELVTALRMVDAEVSFAEITSPYGHDAFLLEPEEQDAFIRPFLNTTYAGIRASEVTS